MSSLLNIIGGGRVGQTLGRAWHSRSIFTIQNVVCRHLAHAEEACAFISAGRPLTSIVEARPARFWLLATTDAALPDVVEELSRSNLVRPKDVIFHVSGASGEEILAPVQSQGATVASVHPVATFPAPISKIEALGSFPVVATGDSAALSLLQPAFEALELAWLEPELSSRAAYHAGMALASNALPPFFQLVEDILATSGIAREAALPLVRNLVTQTIENIFAANPANALTGPVARGDTDTVKKHLEAAQPLGSNAINAYAAFSLLAVDLATSRGTLTPEQIHALRNLLMSALRPVEISKRN